MISCDRFRILLGALGLVIALRLPGIVEARAAEGGATLTPDGSAYLVNRDLGSERWTIGFNVVPGDSSRLVNVTGNVFRSDGQPPSFVVCQANARSVGTLNDPASSFSFTCKGADACQTTAKDCAANGWRVISDAVLLEAGFFLPPGGLGSGSSVVAAESRAECREVACVAQRLRDTVLAAGRRLLASAVAAAVPTRASAANDDRGATLTFDRLAYLANKDIGNERWSIALNAVPVETEQGTVTRVHSVTGNVFRRDGSAPSFVYCTVREDSQGTLEDLTSEFRLSCFGTDACTTNAADCAQRWQLISDDVVQPASFFLPPGGLPATRQSDQEIFIIGTTAGPGSIVTKEFTTGSGAASGRVADAGACPVDEPCFATRLGGCTNVAGRLVDIAGFGCGCQVGDLGACITCGGSASGTCGGDCEFPVGRATARGTCLPVTSDSTDCACYAIGFEQQETVTGCSGPLDSACASGRCCADDPRDGCNVASGDPTCAGICVVNECAQGDSCGICLRQQQTARCGNGLREGSEQCDGADVPASCTDLGFGGGDLACSNACRFETSGCTPLHECNDGTVDPGEECDGADLKGATCKSLGFPFGTLSCNACRLDVSSCRSACRDDADCDDGIFCNGSDRCDLDTGECGAIDTCPAAVFGCLVYGSCDEVKRECPAVRDDARCRPGQSCAPDGSCVSP